MSPHAAAIDVHGLDKRFGAKHAVKGLTLRVERGEIFGFLGANGSGKTTSIRMMCGLLKADGGHGHCLGYDIHRQSRQIKRRVGYMTQRFAYWEDLSVRENLDFVARLCRLPRRRDSVARVMEELELETRAGQLAGALSGGWKQRLSLAAALLREPELLLLDEPTAGVDPGARRAFWACLHELAARGIAILVSTHYMDEAERCHQLACMAHGSVLAQGTAARIVRESGLGTWAISGGTSAELSRLASRLQQESGVGQVLAFGAALHASGTDAERLEQALHAAVPRGLALRRIETSLEDAFIHLMQGHGSGTCGD